MLVGRRLSGDRSVRRLKRSAAWRVADRLVGRPLDAVGLQYALYPSSLGVAGDPWFLDAEVVQLHNLHGSYFSVTALPVLTRLRPTVWLLHDQWAMTGHVAYSLDCERWRHGCGSCPYLHEYPALERDTTAVLWRLKRAAYAGSRLTLVVPSRWLEELVRESPLLRRFPVRRILHGVDLERFRPRPREAARKRFGLPQERRIVVFVASDLTERRKGLAVLDEAIARLNDPPLLVLAGRGRPALRAEARFLGELDDDDALADAYCAADVHAVPTLADALTQTAPESVACGVPCVSFDRGGVVDVVRDGVTGLRARFRDADDLARALQTLLADAELRELLGRRCRETAERELALSRQVTEFERLYEELAAA